MSLAKERLAAENERLRSEVHSWRVRALAAENVLIAGVPSKDQVRKYRRWVGSKDFPNKMPEP